MPGGLQTPLGRVLATRIASICWNGVMGWNASATSG
jgi:hypothetical protein